MACPYGYGDEIAKCALGFPGCMCADDIAFGITREEIAAAIGDLQATERERDLQLREALDAPTPRLRGLQALIDEWPAPSDPGFWAGRS